MNVYMHVSFIHIYTIYMYMHAQGKLFFHPIKVHIWIHKIAKLPWSLLLVIIYITITFTMRLDTHGVDITGVIPAGLPAFKIPENFWSNIPQLVPVTLQMVFIGYLECIAIEAKFAGKVLSSVCVSVYICVRFYVCLLRSEICLEDALSNVCASVFFLYFCMCFFMCV